jgi:alkanesulfonate monooxygenase SsuD/methylene tetrahydromethanopterin reductase-like flavin-dependent oxidoreductase (luciferase family)
MDRQRGIYGDWRKVHPIHFEGEFFKCRGPLNTVPSPQRRPAFVQAGGSPRGRAFAAKHADSIIATANQVGGMKQYRDDVRAHAVKFGRNPDDIKVLFLVYPFLGETSDEAKAKYQRMVGSDSFNGEQGSLDKFAQWDSGKTLRQLASERFDSGLNLIGAPDEVADRMGQAMEEIGGDGFLISTPFQRVSRRFINEEGQNSRIRDLHEGFPAQQPIGW